MKYNYKTNGTCSKEISFDIEDNKIYNVSFVGGCPGNLKAISKLVEGQNVDDIIKKCKGITCGIKNTSCIDQLVKAIESIKEVN